jgi:hypothetical protein
MAQRGGGHSEATLNAQDHSMHEGRGSHKETWGPHRTE